MASVSNLDQDVKKYRESQVTTAAVKEVSTFITGALGEPFKANNEADLSAGLKNGVILCRLADLASPGCVKGFKSRAIMPFVQMENIELFTQACRNRFGLKEHDLFTTANLYEAKDMLQVLRCLGAFSRWANKEAASKFPSPIGGKSRAGALSPEVTGSYARGRGFSNASNTSSAYNSNVRPGSMTPNRTGDSNGRRSPVKAASPGPLSPGGVSSWSKRSDENVTSPAWNISQYGFMGGASQGNLGVSFGGRRQITSAGPSVPHMAEKEKKRKDKEAEEERLKLQAEQDEQRKHEEIEAEERRAQEEEQRRWAEETRKLEQQRQEEEKRQWEEQERKWHLDEERRKMEEREAEDKVRDQRTRARGRSDARLQGQFLSQYQAEHDSKGGDAANDLSESARVRDLERQLAEARERERQYELGRHSRNSDRSRKTTEEHDMAARIEEHDMAARMKEESSRNQARSQSRPRTPSRKNSDEVWREDEREYLREQWGTHHRDKPQEVAPPQPPRPLPEPTASALPVRVKTNHTGPSSRPLPDPAIYASANPPSQSRVDRFLSSNPSPAPAQARTTYSNEIGGFDSAAERDAENQRRHTSQTKTKAGGWAANSLLEREMELERQRQREWEDSQKETTRRVPDGDGIDGVGGGIGGKWDVNQWTGYTGGDGQNKGNQGIGAGRRQIVGPRPPPGR